jgi:hypothetical protein
VLISFLMRKLLRKLEALLTAAAFAEEGDVETARRIVREAEGDERRTGEPPRLVVAPAARAARAARASTG